MCVCSIIEPESDKGLLDILWADPSNDESEVELAQQLGSRSDLDGNMKISSTMCFSAVIITYVSYISFSS